MEYSRARNGREANVRKPLTKEDFLNSLHTRTLKLEMLMREPIERPWETAVLREAERRALKDDPSHDFSHLLRVANLAKNIAEMEGGDLDIVIPAALFHDIIVYRKDSPESARETEESALVAQEVLLGIAQYPLQKIDAVMTCIRE